MVKVKILPAALQGEVTAQTRGIKAAKQTNSALDEVNGHMFILFRKRKAEEEPSQTQFF
jgi:RNA-binding protein YhbY